MTFSQFLFPGISGSFNVEVGSDGYDQLGRGLLASGRFSFYPDQQPTVMRGPGYPALIAFSLAACECCFPSLLQFIQALLHGCTCVLVLFIGLEMLDRRRAILASLLCVVYPPLIWYSARAVAETSSVFLFTATVFLLLRVQQHPARRNAVLLGVVLGASALVRQVFVPLVLLAPFLLVINRVDQQRFRQAAVVLVTAVLIVAPWTMRNWLTADRFIAVHGLSGYNAQVGDYVTEHFVESPFGYLNLVLAADAGLGETHSYMWLRQAEARSGATEDHHLLMTSLHRYIDDPVFLLRKIVINAVLFWGYGSAPVQTLVFTLLQIPLLLVFIAATVRLVRKGHPGALITPLWCVAVYFLGHLPFFAIARYALPLIPTMMVYAVSLFGAEQARPFNSDRVDSSLPL